MLARQAPLGHDRYWRQDALDEELAAFDRCWLFAGLAASFGETPLRLGPPARMVTIARDGGKLVGTNTHGQPLRVDCCGQFVFYSAAPTEPLASYLAPFESDLALLSSSLGAPDHAERVEVACNWKMLVENSLDDYHAATVHARTLFPSIVENGVRQHTRLVRHGRHSHWENGLNPTDIAFWEKLDRRLRLDRFSDETFYRHISIFPNFYAASFYGGMVLTHRIDPLTPETAALDWTLTLPTPGESALRQAVLRDQVAKARVVIDEDVEICGVAQLGRHYASRPTLCGAAEIRIVDFQEALIAATIHARPRA